MIGQPWMIASARSIFCAVAAVLLLAACGTSAPVRYYSLASTVSGGSQAAAEPVVLGLGPIRLPAYLNRSQLVTRGTGAEMEVDDFSQWAEPLAPAIVRVVSTDVDKLLGGVTVLAFPWEAAARGQVDYRLLGEIMRFDADPSGRVVLEIQWGIIEAGSGAPILRPRRTRYEAQAGPGADAAAVALAMNEALAGFSRDVASEMQSKLSD